MHVPTPPPCPGVRRPRAQESAAGSWLRGTPGKPAQPVRFRSIRRRARRLVPTRCRPRPRPRFRRDRFAVSTLRGASDSSSTWASASFAIDSIVAVHSVEHGVLRAGAERRRVRRPRPDGERRDPERGADAGGDPGRRQDEVVCAFGPAVRRRDPSHPARRSASEAPRGQGDRHRRAVHQPVRDAAEGDMPEQAGRRGPEDDEVRVVLLGQLEQPGGGRARVMAHELCLDVVRQVGPGPVEGRVGSTRRGSRGTPRRPWPSRGTTERGRPTRPRGRRRRTGRTCSPDGALPSRARPVRNPRSSSSLASLTCRGSGRRARGARVRAPPLHRSLALVRSAWE